jgi:hypothetical protein
MKGEMTMKKDSINVKETEKKDAAPLSDGELENVVAGICEFPGRVPLGWVSRWKCCQCRALGQWSASEDFINGEKDFHTQQTGHTYFGFISRVVGTFNPHED